MFHGRSIYLLMVPTTYVPIGRSFVLERDHEPGLPKLGHHVANFFEGDRVTGQNLHFESWDARRMHTAVIAEVPQANEE